MPEETKPVDPETRGKSAAEQVGKVIAGVAQNCEILRHNLQRQDTVIRALEERVRKLEEAVKMADKIVVAQAVPRSLVRQ